MRSNFRKIGDYVELVDERNNNLSIDLLLGLSVTKEFIPSVANIIGTSMSNYKIIRKGQFACSLMQVRRDKKMPIALLQDYEVAIISQAYPVFKVKDESQLIPEYLMMWFTRSEFDREACFHAVGGVRGSIEWEDFMNMELPVPSIEKQREIVAEYNTVVDRIKLNEELNKKLEETAQTLYKHWFVDFEFPAYLSGTLSGVEGYKSSGGEMVYNAELDKEIPKGWEVKSLCEIAKITMGQSPNGESFNDKGNGKIFYQGRTDFGFRIPEVRMYTTEPKRNAIKGDVLMSVRAPVGDLNMSVTNCSIGRGIASIRSNDNSYIFYLMKDFKDLFDADAGSGTIFSSINKDELYNLRHIYKNEIANNFNNYSNKIDDLILKVCFEIKELINLKELLLSRMTRV